MKILFIVDFEHFLLDSLFIQLKKNKIEVNQLSLSGRLNQNSNVQWPIYRKLKKVARMLKIIFHVIIHGKKYNAISYHYATEATYYIDLVIKKFCKRRVLTIWGSEYFFKNEKIKNKLLKLYQRMDQLSVTNAAFLENLQKYNLNTKSLSFGLSAIDTIASLKNNGTNKEKARTLLGLDPIKSVIVIGTNASKGQQHLKIIEQIQLIDSQLENKFQILIPLHYGSQESKQQIFAAVISLKTKTTIVTDIMTELDISMLRLATDVLIQVQIADQLSGAMLETLYAGGYVITGTWLPYSVLDQLGIQWTKISSIDKLAFILIREVNDNKKNLDPNSVVIQKHFSWENLTHLWIKFLVGD